MLCQAQTVDMMKRMIVIMGADALLMLNANAMRQKKIMTSAQRRQQTVCVAHVLIRFKNGLNTHGVSIRAQYRVVRLFGVSVWMNMSVDTKVTIAIGRASALKSVGIHKYGLFLLPFIFPFVPTAPYWSRYPY